MSDQPEKLVNAGPRNSPGTPTLCQFNQYFSGPYRPRTLRRADVYADLGAGTLRWLRSYPEAVEFYTRSLELAPDLAEMDVRLGWTWVEWQGTLDSVKAAMDRHPEHSVSPWVQRERAAMLQWAREPDSLLALVRSMSEAFLEGQKGFRPRRLLEAWAYQVREDEAAARQAFELVLLLLDSLVAVGPEDWDLHAARGLTVAGLGLREDALGEADWLQQSSFYGEDRYEGTIAALERARILAQIGAADAALAEIDDLLSRPAWVSHHTLRLDPLFDPIRHDPRFQALLVKYANPEGVG